MSDRSHNTLIAVIGAGPAGMATALEAARRGGQVILLDGNAITGRKLRVTGGGRGNLTNINVTTERYFTHGHSSFISSVLQETGPRELIAYLRGLGILTWHTDDGWVYPVSNSAVNVAALLEARLREAGVQIRLGEPVRDILPVKDGMRLITGSGGEIRCGWVIVAAGGKAYPDLGSTGEMFDVLGGLGHRVLPVMPALAPLETDMKAIHKLQGIRLDAGVTLQRQGGIIAETFGNIIFTNRGINGPGVMDISHWVHETPLEGLSVHLNFLGEYRGEFVNDLTSQRGAKMGIGPLLGMVLPPKLAAVLLEKAHVNAEMPIQQADDRQLAFLVSLMSDFRIEVSGVRGYDHCQVTSGGVPLDEVDPVTLQSRLQPRIWLAGEVLDVIGPCGGYNLHWAFASGIRAGRNIPISK